MWGSGSAPTVTANTPSQHYNWGYYRNSLLNYSPSGHRVQMTINFLRASWLPLTTTRLGDYQCSYAASPKYDARTARASHAHDVCRGLPVPVPLYRPEIPQIATIAQRVGCLKFEAGNKQDDGAPRAERAVSIKILDTSSKRQTAYP